VLARSGAMPNNAATSTGTTRPSLTTPSADLATGLRKGHDRPLVAWLSLAQLVTWGSVFYTFALLVEPVERELGLTRTQSSLAFSLALLAEGLMAYPVGRWIDRGHERFVMAGGSLAIAAGLALHALAVHSAPGFFAVWLLLGAGLAATLYNPVFAVVTRRFPGDFRRAIITITFLGGLASSVFIPLSAALIAAWGWRAALLVLAALQLLVCFPIHWRVLRDAPRPAPVAATGSASPAALLRGAPFLLVGVFVVGMMGITAAIPPHLVSLLRESGLAEAWVLAIPASIGAVQVLGRVLLYVFEGRVDLHLVNRVVPLLIPLALAALMAGAASPWAGLLFVLLYGLGNGMLTIVKGTAIPQYVSREHVASLTGALGVPTALARALAPMLLGVLWSHEAGYRGGLALLLAVGVLAALALVGAQRRASADR
jgi:MFS family permease